MKISEKEYVVIMAMAMSYGGYKAHCWDMRTTEPDEELTFSEKLSDEDSWFKTKNGDYFLGYDQKKCGYVVEWRGRAKVDGESAYVREHIVTGPKEAYMFDTANLIIDAIRKHKRYLKNEGES